MTAGIMVNIIKGGNTFQSNQPSINNSSEESFGERLKSLFSYIEYELLGSIANALIVGIIVAGIISTLIPDGLFEKHLSSNFLSMALMLLAAIPLYVCASASTPIAASLIMKGISPGAALVFLLAGPATNAITISTVVKTLGKRSAFVYLASIAFVGLSLGYLLNVFAERYGLESIILVHQHEMLPEWLKAAGTASLSIMLGWYYLKSKILKKEKYMVENKTKLSVEGMTCMHCAGNVQNAVASVNGISNVSVDLEGKAVYFDMDEDVDIEKVKAAITFAGYSV
jgi:copper chaperone CopZ